MDQHDPFAGMASSQAEKAVLRKQLETLVEHSAYPGIRDMARDVLDGRTDLRGAMLGARYEQAVNEAAREFSSWYRGLSDQERAEQVCQGREYEEELEQAATPRPPGARRPRPPVEDDGWEPPATILKKRKPRG
jgi:hypothetical protein